MKLENKNKPVKKYTYNGIVKDIKNRFKPYITSNTTYAPTLSKAKSNIQYQIKKEHGYGDSSPSFILDDKGFTEEELDINRSNSINTITDIISTDDVCPQCGSKLNDAGECPLCDLGDETVLDESMQEIDSEGNPLTPQQVDFFRNSKIRDNNGYLLVCYHGTDKHFDTFEKGDIGFHFGKIQHARARVKWSRDGKGEIYGFYLNIKNPYRANNDSVQWDPYYVAYRLCCTKVDMFSPFENIKLTDKEYKDLSTMFDIPSKYTIGKKGSFYEKDKLRDLENLMQGIEDEEGYLDTSFTNAERELVLSIFTSRGYDGIIYPNEWESEDDTGYPAGDGQDSYIAFYPDQIKSIGNKTPTNSRKFNEDLNSEVDSMGNNLTPGQIEFFKNSKARDDKGHLLVLYHGSKSKTDFDTFKYDPNNQSGDDWGKAFYFTNNKSKAQGYSVDVDTDKRVQKYKKDTDELFNHFRNNPNEETKKAYKDYRDKNNLYALLDDEDYEHNTERLGTLKTCYLNMTNPYIYDARGEYYFNIYDEVFEDAIEDGYDSIIIKNVIDNPRGAAVPMDVYVVFNENQIKSINNTDPTNSNNINEDLTKETDANGNELSLEQSKFFKDSKIRNAQGKLLPMYHGTMNGKFDTFELGRYQQVDEFAWFAADRKYSDNYAGYEYKDTDSYTFTVYLNVKNPFNTGDTHQPAVEEDEETPTKYTIDIANRLNVDPYTLVEIGQNETAFGTELFDITRTSEFRDILKERGYDGQIANEFGTMTVGCMYQDQIKSVDNLNPTNSHNINEHLGSNVNESKLFVFPNSKQAIDTYWKDRKANVEKVSIKQLVDDNNLLDDDDLQSYHQRQWDNKSAKEFSINQDKVNNWRVSEVPYVVRKKDGRLELGDGRHRTRALYNDGYEYVELPVIVDEGLDMTKFNIKDLYHCSPSKEIDINKEDTMLWFSESLEYAFNYGLNLFVADISLHNPIDVGNTDLYIRDLIPTKFGKEFIEIANKLGVEPKVLASLDTDAKRILSIVQLPKFKEMCINKGYDGITSIEDGAKCYCVFNLSQVNITKTYLTSSLTEATIKLDSRVKDLADECVSTLNSNGLTLPNNLVIESSDRVRALGDASYPKSEYNGNFRVRVSKYMNNLTDDQIKNTIYHELGHILAYVDDLNKGYVYIDKNGDTRLSGKTRNEMLRNKRKLSHHGPRWVDIMNKISKITGQEYSRLANAEDTAAYNDAASDRYKYKFVCPSCGQVLKYTRMTPFVKEYADDAPNGDPYWYCSPCYKNYNKKIKFVKVDD